MKLAVIFLALLMSLLISFAPQETEPAVCRGKVLPITLIPGPPMTVNTYVKLRFGGTRPPPLPWTHGFPTEKGFKLVIRTREEFSNYWKRLTSPVPPGQWVPPLPEIDFSKEMIVVSAMGMRPSPGYSTLIDGACEVNGQVKVFISNLDKTAPCGAALGVISYPADAVRIPRSDLPVVFHETELTCAEWVKRGTLKK